MVFIGRWCCDSRAEKRGRLSVNRTVVPTRCWCWFRYWLRAGSATQFMRHFVTRFRSCVQILWLAFWGTHYLAIFRVSHWGIVIARRLPDCTREEMNMLLGRSVWNIFFICGSTNRFYPLLSQSVAQFFDDGVTVPQELYVKCHVRKWLSVDQQLWDWLVQNTCRAEKTYQEKLSCKNIPRKTIML